MRKKIVIKVIHVRKEEVKRSVVADDMILYREKSKKFIQIILELINEFSKIASDMSNI